jgi:uncharacterized protein (DUF58 family)
MENAIGRFLSARELHRIERLTLQSRYVVEGNLAGRHRSPLRGASSEFADHRAYFPGDDPKHIDWKVLGRTERYFVRRYEDETNLRVYLIVDRSASMEYGSAGRSKYDYACRLAAAIGYVVVRSRDSVGLHLYSDKIDASMGARNSLVHLNNVLGVLAGSQPAAATATAATLHQVAEAIHKRALVVLLSDLFEDPDGVVRALAHFRKRRHDVIIFHVLDACEIEFPFRRGAEFEDMETGEKVTVDVRRLAAEYRRAFAEFVEKYSQPCREMNIDYRLVNTSRPHDAFVRAYLEERRKLAR